MKSSMDGWPVNAFLLASVACTSLYFLIRTIEVEGRDIIALYFLLAFSLFLVSPCLAFNVCCVDQALTDNQPKH